MPQAAVRRSWTKRILFIVGGAFVFVLLFVIACHIAVEQMFRGIEQSKATGLSAVAWDTRSMWASSRLFGGYQHSIPADVAAVTPLGLVSRSAQLRSCTSSFDQAVAQLHEVVSAHQGYFDDLRTQNQTGQGRLLSVALAFPATNFDAALSDIKKIGRVVSVSEAGEDASVKLASQARQLASARTNLARLQKRRREHSDRLTDALALEKEIATANEGVAEAARRQEELQSTVAQAHISFALLEDYRAPLQATLEAEPLALRNSLVEGVAAIFSSIGLVVAVGLEYGLPLLFWFACLFFPVRVAWRRFRSSRPSPAPAIS
jgi:Domain of unknown function (DUF4349)